MYLNFVAIDGVIKNQLNETSKSVNNVKCKALVITIRYQ
jgi:hypothetical protein